MRDRSFDASATYPPRRTTETRGLLRGIVIIASVLALAFQLSSAVVAAAGIPQIAVSAPPNVVGTVPIHVQLAASAGVLSVKLYLGKKVIGTYQAPGVTEATYQWDSTTVKDGKHTISAKAVDPLGNVGSAQTTVTVRNAPVPPAPPAPTPPTPATPPAPAALPRPTSATLTADKLGTQVVGTTINFTAEASGGVAPLLYKFVQFDDTLTVLRDWSTTKTHAWTPKQPYPFVGVAVWVKSQGDPGNTYEEVGVGANLKFVIVAPTPPPAPAQNPPPAGSLPLPSSTLELLVGPITPMGSTAYDQFQLTAARQFAEIYPAGLGVYDNVHSDDISKNFYDFALSLYTVYYRTGDPYWLTKARVVATDWMNSKFHTDVPIFLERGFPDGLTLPYNGFASITHGLAVMAAESGNQQASQAVRDHAEFYGKASAGLTGTPNGYYDVRGDGRDMGYRLIAATVATIIGHPYQAEAKRQLDVILAHEQDGFWDTRTGIDVPGTPPYAANFMNGIMTEAMVLYDRAIGDPRILPALARYADWMWQTQWVASAQAFYYHSESYAPDGLYKDLYPGLNGFQLPVWGYLYMKTGDQKYLDQGNEILRGLVERGPDELYGQKQFSQMFRSSPRYLGFTSP
jgi:hypothetical protein